MRVYFRQLRLPDIGCASYILGGDGECAVVDPRWDAVSQYLGLARREGLEVRAIIETHTHADHVSGATRLAARTGAPIYLHRSAEVSYPHRDLDDGDELAVGPLRIRVLHTPGHSFDSISLLVTDTSGTLSPRLLTGDTLFAGDLGRPDLHRAAGGPAELAAALFTTVRERLLPLEDSLEVFPGHLAGSLCGKRIEPEPSTTIGRERQANPMLAMSDLDTFVRDILTDQPVRPPNMDHIVALNRSGPPLSRPEVRTISPTAARGLLDRVTVIDTRDYPLFAAGHIQGSINVPVSYGQLGLMVSWVVDAETPLLLVANDEEDLHDAVDSLMVLGMTNPLYALEGDEAAWREAGLPLATLPLVDARELARMLERGEVGSIVDVREPSEVEKQGGTLPGARIVPYRALGGDKPLPLLQEPVVVVCNSGNRSGLGASLLARRGLRCINLAGGTTAWTDSGRILAPAGAAVAG